MPHRRQDLATYGGNDQVTQLGRSITTDTNRSSVRAGRWGSEDPGVGGLVPPQPEGFAAAEVCVFWAHHALGDEELSALVVWWLGRANVT
jgi:hypothetical protein